MYQSHCAPRGSEQPLEKAIDNCSVSDFEPIRTSDSESSSNGQRLAPKSSRWGKSTSMFSCFIILPSESLREWVGAPQSSTCKRSARSARSFAGARQSSPCSLSKPASPSNLSIVSRSPPACGGLQSEVILKLRVLGLKPQASSLKPSASSSKPQALGLKSQASSPKRQSCIWTSARQLLKLPERNGLCNL